jgi:exosortase A-associated hydrolase 2
MTSTPEDRPRSDPRFLEVGGRRLFALQLLPAGRPRGSVLYLPPFAEEMNRCRSHVAASARALTALGYRCLLLDLLGTGESEGDIAEARWERWVEDACGALQWLGDTGDEPVTLWGLRTGALLAAEVAAAQPQAVQGLLFWQPVLDGALFVNQYLRLRLASQLVQAGDKETTDSLRQRLAAGETIEVAGYPFTGAMAGSLGARKLSLGPELARLPLAWAEVVSKPAQPLSPGSRRFIDACVAAGGAPRVEAVACPMVWQLAEREEAPALRDATLRLMRGVVA